MDGKLKKSLIGGLILALAATATFAQMHSQGLRHHGADGTGHDEVTMPGLRGLNATNEETAGFPDLFRAFQTITREVENLPNGIRTVTRAMLAQSFWPS